MKFAVTLLLLAAMAGAMQAFSVRQLIGTCVEMCSSDADCDHGLRCLSNGCGHVCRTQLFHNIGTGCSGAMCNHYCPHGHAVDANGCPTCGCNPDPTTA